MEKSREPEGESPDSGMSTSELDILKPTQNVIIKVMSIKNVKQTPVERSIMCINATIRRNKQDAWVAQSVKWLPSALVMIPVSWD